MDSAKDFLCGTLGKFLIKYFYIVNNLLNSIEYLIYN